MSRQKEIVSKDFVPGVDDTAELYDPHIMQAYERLMDLIKEHSAGFDPSPHGYLDYDFPNEYYFDENDYIDDDVVDYANSNRKTGYCGFSRNFLDRTSVETRSLHPPCPPHLSYVPYTPGFRVIRPTAEEAERNAQELLKEEERIKEKAEKKRLKKMKQKERKQQEKCKQENANMKNKDVKENPEVAGSSIKPVLKPKLEFNKPEDSCAQFRKSESPALSTENQDSSNNPSEDEEREAESIPSEPEELDMTSSFVSKAAIIAKRKLELRSKPEKKEKKKSTVNQSKEKPNVAQEDQQQNGAVCKVDDVIVKSIELAVIGNKLASTGCFELAVRYFTDAIKCNPKEFRLFGNRSFCYEKMQMYDKSLTDAEISLTMCPSWIKGLYRKGRALAGLKRYGEAAKAFRDLLKVDNTCLDAAQELMAVQIMQLMDLGLTREQSSNALIIHGTVEKALEALSNIPDVKLLDPSPPAACASHSAAVGEKDPPKPGLLVKSGPPQPQLVAEKLCHSEGVLYPVWVGNLAPAVSEMMIRSIFSAAGEIHSLKVLRARRCAFINYTSDEYCQKAISDIHGMEVEGASLIVRYPDRLPTHLGMSRSAHPTAELPKTAPKSMSECFFWRNNGCVKKNCIYRHVPEHKGIDRRKGQTSVPGLSPPHPTTADSK